MLYTNLRNVLAQDLIFADPDQGPAVEGKLRRVKDLAIYEKKPEQTVYIIGEDRDHISCITKQRKVIVPLISYKSDDEVQERILCLLDAVARNDFSDTPHSTPPTCTPEEALIFWGRTLKTPLAAIVADEAVAKKFEAIVPPEVRVHVAPGTRMGNVAYGLSDRDYVGHLVLCPTQGQGLIVHGQVVGVGLN